MNKDTINRMMCDFTATSPLNRVGDDRALRPDLAGMRLFQEPIVGYAAADDPFFETLRRPEVVGPQFRLPREWLPAANTVISFFLPFDDVITASNSRDIEWPSYEWLHGRIEGQAFIGALSAHLAKAFQDAGFYAVSPCIDPSHRIWDTPPGTDESGAATPGFTSTWSERHVAHVAGLGTFSLSAGMITRKGMAGRFGSIVTSQALEPDPRPYSSYDEYCTHCGACIRRCPVSAISPAGKSHNACRTFTRGVLEKHRPWYGCGKCQVRVPCERGIPKKAANTGDSSRKSDARVCF